MCSPYLGHTGHTPASSLGYIQVSSEGDHSNQGFAVGVYVTTAGGQGLCLTSRLHVPGAAILTQGADGG